MRSVLQRLMTLVAVVAVLVFVVGYAVGASAQQTGTTLNLSGAIYPGACGTTDQNAAFQAGSFISVDEADLIGYRDVGPLLRSEATIDSTMDALFPDGGAYSFVVTDNTGTAVACGELGGVLVNGQVTIGLFAQTGANRNLVGVAIFGSTDTSTGQVPVQGYLFVNALEEKTPPVAGATIAPTVSSPPSTQAPTGTQAVVGSPTATEAAIATPTTTETPAGEGYLSVEKLYCTGIEDVWYIIWGEGEADGETELPEELQDADCELGDATFDIYAFEDLSSDPVVTFTTQGGYADVGPLPAGTHALVEVSSGALIEFTIVADETTYLSVLDPVEGPPPTGVPTEEPTTLPTEVPTTEPTEVPTTEPTAVPTEVPTTVPTEVPTTIPTEVPTSLPTEEPTAVPTEVPTA